MKTMQFRSLRQENARARFDELNLLATVDVALARDLLNPYEIDPMRIDLGKIAAITARLKNTVSEMTRLKNIIQHSKLSDGAVRMRQNEVSVNGAILAGA